MFNQILINRNNLINNVKQVIKENPNSKICVMTKANAYGVGDREVVQILDEFVDFWGVACFFEANKILGLTKKKILIVGALEKENIREDISYTCSSIEDIKYLISLNKTISIHLKINTGMNRYGFKNIKEVKKALNLVGKSKLKLEGVFTHFATGDEYVEKQFEKFKKFYELTFKLGFSPIVHADNSLVNEKHNHNLDMVRVGHSIYNRCEKCFLPAVEIKTKIVQVCEIKKNELVGYDYRFVAKKNMRIGILPVGYADGLDLKLIGFKLKVGNKDCEIVNICMDCCMIDITDLEIKKGDEIYLLNKFNPLKLFADYLETSVYEVMARFSLMRAERIII